ncbi:MAG: peptidoglycan DD-metalloendopeptidase family protein [Chitinispirillales bacterium]|jgi:murein DD-endopeptidase MepM/ murein hydrolase activator NlpD|nr:peptidoglycan DD-metalloendopeptidase family protein [Chitinispirillales bacterium]
MKLKSKSVRRFSVTTISIFVFVLALVAIASIPDVDFSLAFEDCVIGISLEDSAAESQYREELGQDFSSLFDDLDSDNFMAIDTLFAWSNERINSGRFDYRTLGPEDTIRIPLVDTAQSKFYVHPFNNFVTSRFGQRRFLWHYGIDVKLNTGDTVHNALDGIVRVIQFDRRGYGNVVVVRHHNGLETLYGHLHRVTVEPNQMIKAGEMVGLGGNTGRSTGAHLHFEIRYFGEPFNPEHIIDFKNYTLKNDTLVLTRDNFEYLTVQRQRVIHVVRRGDNLGAIARRYGTTVNALCRLNGITPRTTLRVGQRLIVRSGEEAQRQVVQTTAPETPPATPPASADVSMSTSVSVDVDVGRGDTED